MLLTRRVLTTALGSVTEAQLHCETPIGERADCAAESCATEASLIWPEALPPAQLDPPQTPVQVLFALVRHCAVTEEVLMQQAADETMQQVWWTRARRLAQDPAQTLAESLRQLAMQEFEIATKLAEIRAQIDPDRSAQPELAERAREEIAAVRSAIWFELDGKTRRTKCWIATAK